MPQQVAGIQLKGPTHGLGISGSHDIVIRHLRIRPGGTADGTYNTNAAVLISGDSRNIVIDHCSLQWQNHHILETYNAGENITYQWNIVGEGSATPYGFSMSMTGGQNGAIRTFSVHHNLILHSVGSNPMVGATKYYDFRNNVVYNWVGDSVLTAGSPGNTSILNFVNNHYIAGPNSGEPAHYLRNGDASADRGGTKIFTEGNWSPKCPTGCANDWDNNFRDWDFSGTPVAVESKYRVKTPFPVPAVTTLPTKDVKDTVLAFVGANKPVRDSLDARLVNDVKTGKGYDPSKVGFGPWPTLEDVPAPADKDHDGMSDAWEMAHGLNPGDPADGPAFAKNGYTNVENYLNELAGDPVP